MESPVPECWRRVIVAARGRKSSASGTHPAPAAFAMGLSWAFGVDKGDEVILNLRQAALPCLPSVIALRR